MAGLDAKRVRGESPNLAFRSARGASSAPAVLVSAHPVVASAESARSAFAIALAVLAPFIAPQPYDQTSKYTFFMRQSTRPALSFCLIRSLGGETSIV